MFGYPLLLSWHKLLACIAYTVYPIFDSHTIARLNDRPNCGYACKACDKVIHFDTV